MDTELKATAEVVLVVDVACFRHNHLLLVKKRNVWILPGGKPKFGVDESDRDCLLRECFEELPHAQFQFHSLWAPFDGITEHSKSCILVHVYFGDVIGELTTGGEVSGAGFFSVKEMLAPDFGLSGVTRKIVDRLVNEGYIRDID